MTFSTKLGISVSAVFLASFIIIAYVGYRSTTEILEDEIRVYLEDHAHDAVDKLGRMLHERYADISILSTDPILSSTPAQITERLKQYRDKYKTYSSLSFFDMNRVRIADTSGKDIGKQHAMTEYWKEIAAGKDIVMKITESKTTKQAIIHFVAVVKGKQGKPFGVVASRMPIESIHEVVKQGSHIGRAQEHTKVELLDKDGMILYSSYNQKGMLKEKSRDWEFLRPVISSGKRSGSVRHAYEGEDEITAFAIEQGHKGFSGNGWAMVICTPASIAFAPAHAQRKLFVYLFSGFIGIVLVTSLLVSRAAVRPLKKLAGAVTEIGKGNFDIHVDVTSEDEVGRLAWAFNAMAADLKNNEKKYRDLAELLPQFVFETDDKGNMRFFNRFALEHLGYSQDDFNNGLHAFQMFIPEDRDRVRENIQRVLSGEFVDGLESTVVRKDGTTIPVLISASTIVREDKITGIRGIATDITERKKAEAEREKLILELQDALARVKQLSGMLPICASCKKIRDDKGYWNQIEVYLREHSEAEFTHGICPDCAKKYMEEMDKLKKQKDN